MLLSAIFLYGVLAQTFVVTIIGDTLCKCSHLVSLQLGNSPDFHFCSASIIDKDKIMTTAKCVENTNNFSIVIGTNDLRQNGEVNFVKNICTQNDVAIIILTKSISYNKTQSAISLANSAPASGTICTLCGWGKINEDETLVPICQEINKTISECKGEDQDMPSNRFCADNSHEIDDWHGDPGASFVCKNELVGISETFCPSDPCTVDEPDIYINVSNNYDFINSCTDTS